MRGNSDREIVKPIKSKKFQAKLDQSPLPMQGRGDCKKFLRKVFIRLQKKLRSLPRQMHCNYHCSCANYTWRENVSSSLSIRCFIPGELGSKCPMIKELA